MAQIWTRQTALEQVEILFDQNSSATAEQIGFCAAIASAQQGFSLPGTQSTVARTLTHLVSSEQLYLQTVTGREPTDWTESFVVHLAGVILTLASIAMLTRRR